MARFPIIDRAEYYIPWIWVVSGRYRKRMPQEETTVHTIAIAGRPTLVVNGSKDEVQDLLTDSWLLEDLLVLETQGRPLWFGRTKDFFVRPASEGEVLHWEEAFSRALSEGHVTEWDRDGYIVYLVPVSDPAADEDDESLDEP